MPHQGRVFLLASFLDDPGIAAQVGTARSALDQQQHNLIRGFKRKEIRIWEYS
jgi:hypothetical protein